MMPFCYIALSYLCNIFDLAWKFTLHCPIYVGVYYLWSTAYWRHPYRNVMATGGMMNNKTKSKTQIVEKWTSFRGPKKGNFRPNFKNQPSIM